MLVGALLVTAYNLSGSPSVAMERLIGAEKVFTQLVKNEIGAPEFELVPLDNDIAAFIGLDRLINFVHMRSKIVNRTCFQYLERDEELVLHKM